MFNLIYNSPEQLKDALGKTGRTLSEEKSKKYLKQSKDFSNVVISGMGGSGLPGDIIYSLIYNQISIPIINIKDYLLPNFINKRTLYFAVSYSGDTEETITSYEQARKAGCVIVVITSNGTLKRLAEKNGHLLFELPKNLPPRQAWAHLFMPIILTLSKAKLIPEYSETIINSAEYLIKNRARLNKKAKKLAFSLLNKLPYIIASSLFFAPVAYRWKTQLNENTKIMAFCNTLPEQNHNEINGVGFPVFLKKHLYLILLNDPNAYHRNQRRVKLLPKLIGNNLSKIETITPKGKNNFENIFSLIMLGDLTSFHLANLYGVDALKIEKIELLKSLLAR